MDTASSSAKEKQNHLSVINDKDTTSSSIKEERNYLLVTSNNSKTVNAGSCSFEINHTMAQMGISGMALAYMRPLVIRMREFEEVKPRADSDLSRQEGICLKLGDVLDLNVHSGTLRFPDNTGGVSGALVFFHHDDNEPIILQRGEGNIWRGCWEFRRSSLATLYFSDLHGNALCPKQFSVVLELSNVPFKD